MDYRSRFSFNEEFSTEFDSKDKMLEFINLKFAAKGLPIYGEAADYPFLEMGKSLLASVREKNRLLSEHLCPVDQRIQDFLSGYLEDDSRMWLPTDSLILEKHGLSRTLSLPSNKDKFESDIIKSYRVKQGVCHNPRSDRRTTKGVFHIAEGGLPIPADKKAVPKNVYANLLKQALLPPEALLELPFSSDQDEKARTFVSILLRPLVAPEVKGVFSQKNMEVRFFAPGNMVANLDFVESIFGNAGDPFLPENDARLDVEHWTGHTGCVILAPQLTTFTKKELGLPHVDDATDRQKSDGMCWSDESELYNDGSAFKLTARTNEGVMVTMIADNYFGYCKKEVKTMLSYAANLYGQAEEEHAGGALVFPSRNHGEEFRLADFDPELDQSLEGVIERFGEHLDIRDEGYAVDSEFDDILYVPRDAYFNLRTMKVSWVKDGAEQSIKLLPFITYVLPSGYKIEMRQPSQGRRWRLMGTNAEGTFCHKPCTVSGGGKSEISKPITDAMLSGPFLTFDLHDDFKWVQKVINKDFSERYKVPHHPGKSSRPLLSQDRSLGSVIKLLSTNPDYTDAFNDWVESVPSHVREIVFVVKRFYKESWGEDWPKRFHVDRINGQPGKELKYNDVKLISSCLRVGFEENDDWRTFVLRQDFNAAQKIQTEDDITASVILPRKEVDHLYSRIVAPSVKFSENCEHRLFQRPDDAVIRGYDNTAESDFSESGVFFSNYEPIEREQAQEMIDDIIRFDQYTKPIQKMIRRVAKGKKGDVPDYFILTSHPRVLEDGTTTKNPRYLQNRPDLRMKRERYLASVGASLHRRIPQDLPVHFPVNAVLPGRRHNPPIPESGIRALAVYNPIHYQELPELFMEYVASLTGKSPSTTGAGSEGALTKRPFNALPPIIDLNNALVGYILCEHSGFVTAAGYVGPKVRVDHDVSLLMPELWCRMMPEERTPQYLISEGYLELTPDLDYKGKKVVSSRLGYRINERFVSTYFGRIFSNPTSVFTKEMLAPELQGLDLFAEGMDNIINTMQVVAKEYFDDGSIEFACPPLKALLNIMAYGTYEGNDVNSPAVRDLFTYDALMQSDWYHERLSTHQKVETMLWDAHLAYLQKFRDNPMYEEAEKRLDIPGKIALATDKLAHVQSEAFLKGLVGTLGNDPMPWSFT